MTRTASLRLDSPAKAVSKRQMDGSVYRHLEREWVQDFFGTGRLLLTTLLHCRGHDQSNRKDPRDGKVNFSISDDRQMLAGISTAGQRSYMLCASRSHDRAIQARFGTESWIEIFDVAGFRDAVADAMGCTGEALVDCCRYDDAKEVNRAAASPLSSFLEELYKTTFDPNVDIAAEFDKTTAQIGQFIEQQVGDEVYFMKGRDFEVEEEVRFVWPVDHAVNGPRIFSCPDARQFCKPGP